MLLRVRMQLGESPKPQITYTLPRTKSTTKLQPNRNTEISDNCLRGALHEQMATAATEDGRPPYTHRPQGEAEMQGGAICKTSR